MCEIVFRGEAYLLSVICDKISEGLRGLVHVVPRDALWSRDKGALGWMYTGPHKWWHAQQTKPGTIRPTANRFRAVKVGIAPATSVKRDTLAHEQISIRQSICVC